MKTKTLIMVCLLTGIGLTRLSAQDVYPPLPPDNQNGTGSVSSWMFLEDYYSVPVLSSDGNVIDWLAGDVNIHTVDNFKNGVWIWRKLEFSGDVVSVGLDFESGTGEVFRIKDVWKYDPAGAMGPGHFNAIGNQGSHYIISYIFHDADFSFSLVRAVSPGKK